MIETATEICSVALFDGDALIDARHEVIGRGHAERLLPMIAELHQGGHAQNILIGCGPGSFTGLRVGVAAARALALGWGAAVSGYSTIALIAAQSFKAHPEIEILCVALHGGHGEIFTQCFSQSPFEERSSLASHVPEVAARVIPPHSVAGNAAETLLNARGYGERIEAEIYAEGVQHLPASFLCLSPSPLYVRGADAMPMA